MPEFLHRLPDWFLKLDELIGFFSVGLFAAAILAGIAITLLSKVWPAPYVPLLTNLPTPLETNSNAHWIFGDYFGFKFRFRLAAKDDLKLFSDMIEGDPAATRANPGLNRSALYNTWFAANPETFMFLDVRKPSESGWDTAAVSIVLPLTRKGLSGLLNGDVEVRDLGRSHIASKGSRPSAILIDTLIANSKYRERNAAMVFSLSVAHASRFWVPKGRKNIEYLIEPDHAGFPRLLPKMGFEGPYEMKRGHKLFRLRYPLIKGQQSETAKETSSLLLDNLRKASQWQIRY